MLRAHCLCTSVYASDSALDPLLPRRLHCSAVQGSIQENLSLSGGAVFDLRAATVLAGTRLRQGVAVAVDCGSMGEPTHGFLSIVKCSSVMLVFKTVDCCLCPGHN